MGSPYARIVLNLLAALCAGGLIGLERSRRGRQAGFREHTLVCLATCQLMLMSVYNWTGGVLASHPYDASASHMVQGIMSGIGFLGAGGIIKEGFSVRGLTTAASIWMTATIGILIGVEFYFPAAVTTALTLAALTLLRWLEKKMRTEHEAQLHLRQLRDGALHELEILALVRRHGFSAAGLSAYGAGEGRYLDFKGVLATKDAANTHRLMETLANDERFVEFALVPLGD
jgi:putative Mg2+ transporter-C (MgtC) family protein